MKRAKFLKNNQQGITLLLAILILASIMAVALSLSAILMVEVRNSGDLLKAEPAFYGAQAITEEALFKLKRKAGNNYSTSIGNVNLNSPAPYESLLADSVQVIKVPKIDDTFATTTVRFPIYNIDNPSGSLPSIPAGSYSYIKVKLISGANVQIFLCEYSVDASSEYDCESLSSSNITVNGTNSAHLSTTLSPTWGKAINPNQQQELRLANTSGVTSGQDAYVQLETYEPDPDNLGAFRPKGLPFFAETAVDINSSVGGVNRKIRVLIPNSSN